jgi:hypothetical protein
MLKCPIHDLPRNIVINNFYARLLEHYRDYLDSCFEGSFTSKEVDAKWDLLETIQSNIEDWDSDKGKGSGINYEYNIFSSRTIEEKARYDYNMPPIFDDYGDENSYFGEFAPTTIVHVGSINSFMQVAHDKDGLCDSYIFNSIHDATESYYERGKHGLRDLNNIKFPLFLLEFLKLYLFCLPMLVALCFHDLSIYKTLFHRKWFRFKFVPYLLF